MYGNYHNYDKSPEIQIAGYDSHAFSGYAAICREIQSRIAGMEHPVVVLDCYPNVREEELLAGLEELGLPLRIHAEDCMIDLETYRAKVQEDLTNDRVFGVMTTKRLEQFFLPEKLEKARETIRQASSGVLVYGVGAGLITHGDLYLYCDLARWEIQTRYKQGASNFHTHNPDTPQLTKYKQGFFLEWRMADRHKKKQFERMDYLLDTNQADSPKMITGEAFRAALKQAAGRPFRLVPYFDPGVWGGQWMKEVCGLPEDRPNYAWSFDGVPEENSLYFRFGDVRVEVPAIDLVFYQPRALLGERVHARFGDEFPIRFDFLDTMEGQNLSLQVHPLTEYIQNTFGMHYTQDESYYILDCAKQDTFVYLGLREGIDPAEMIADLKQAQTGEVPFDAERYVNKIPVQKHDHVLIPAGTVHCSGANTMVLEISSTPYIFTFKLWDWGRLGLDGLPRPIHIEHGEQVIQWDRTTPWVMDNLVGQTQILRTEEGITEERTGLHEREFIETRRHRFSKEVLHQNEGSVHMLNLVEGEEAEVFSPSGQFDPFIVHYAETFILPAAVGEYGIRPTPRSKGQELMTIRASVR